MPPEGPVPAGSPAAAWDERYRAAPIWSGEPNRVLVEEAGDLAPGSALDVGCGEGADAIWLAHRGWRVTGVDVSAEALRRASERAEREGVGDRTEWLRLDLNTGDLEGRFDIVTCSFLHSTVALDRERILAALPELVAHGGTLLVVGHAEPPPWSRPAHGPGGHEAHADHGLPTVEEVQRALGLGGGWNVVRAEVRGRNATGPGGTTGRLLDTVVRVERAAASSP